MTKIEQIAAVRERMQVLRAERAALHAQPRTRDDVRAKVIATVDEWHAQARKRHEWNLRQIASGQHAWLVDVGRSDNLGPLWTLMQGRDAVERALLDGIDLIPQGVTEAQRAARLAEIATEMGTAEVEEECLIEEAESNGERVWRRGDADPAVVLGPRD